MKKPNSKTDAFSLAHTLLIRQGPLQIAKSIPTSGYILIELDYLKTAIYRMLKFVLGTFKFSEYEGLISGKI